MIYLFPRKEFIKEKLREVIVSLLKLVNSISPKLLIFMIKLCSVFSRRAHFAHLMFETNEEKIDDIVDAILKQNLLGDFLLHTSTISEKIYHSIIRNQWQDRFLKCFYYDMRKRRFVAYLFYFNFSLNFDESVSNKIEEYITISNDIELKQGEYQRDLLKAYNEKK